MLDLVKQLCELYKEKKEEEKMRAALVGAELSYEMLEKIAGMHGDKKISVQVGTSIVTIEPKSAAELRGYKPFRDQFEEAHK